MKAFSLEPTCVCAPVTSKVAPSPGAKPSPPTSTSAHRTGVPSYVLLALPLVSVTARGAIVTVALLVTVS